MLIRGHIRLLQASAALVGVLCLISCRQEKPHSKIAADYKLTQDEIRDVHQRTGVTDSELMEASQHPEQLLKLLSRMRFRDLPAARETFWYYQERSESGRVPARARLEAVRAVNALANRLTRQGKCSLALLPLNCVRGWTAGLNPNHSGWQYFGPYDVGGRTRAIVIDPNDPESMWVGSVAGGVWHKSSGSDDFSPVNDLMANLVISTIAIDPTNSRILYAGTGEGFFNLDSLRGAGIFRTTDGVTWSQIGSTIPASDDGPFKFVNRLAISPDGRVLLAATWKGIYRSDDVAHQTWTLQLPGNMADVVFHPTDPMKAIAGGLNTGDAYYSIDGGITWKAAAHQGPWEHVWSDRSRTPSRVEVTFAAADRDSKHHIVYASVDNNSGEIWRSTDDGQSYTRQGSMTVSGELAYYLGDQGWYDNAIWAGDPSAPDFIVVGGVNVWKSENGGTVLTEISDWENEASIHPDQHTIVSSPNYDGGSNKTVFFGNDGGIYRADDIKSAGTDPKKISGWTKINHNYGVTQFYGVTWNKEANSLLGGAQDNGTLHLQLTPDGLPGNWNEEFGGDGGFCSSDPGDRKFLYGEYIFLSLHRSSDMGRTAEFINGEYVDSNDHLQWKQDARLRVGDSYDGTANFIAPFALDPRDGNGATILAGGASLWRTQDAKQPNSPTSGPHWSRIKDPVPGWNDGTDVPNYISAIGISTRPPVSVWVGYNRGDLYVTHDPDAAAPHWEKVDVIGARMPRRLVTRILPDAVNGGTVYVTYGGYSDALAHDNVWKTTNGGSSWRNISVGLPSAPVFAITMHPQKQNYIYVGTEIGIFASEDGGAHWSLSNEGPVNTAVHDFTWMRSKLVAATHGRGIWAIDLTIPDRP